MRTETVEIYKFNELPTESAKERAREWWRNGLEFALSDESRHSIEAFCEHFGVTLRDWYVGPYEPFNYSTNAENHHFRGRKLRDFKHDNMPTGYYLDCSLWGAFYDGFKATGDAKSAFHAGMSAGFAAWRADMEGQLENEHIDEMLIINDYEFTANGCIHLRGRP